MHLGPNCEFSSSSKAGIDGNEEWLTHSQTKLLLYRVIQEEGLTFLESTVPVIVRKKVHTNACLVLNSYQDKGVSAWCILFVPPYSLMR